MVRRAIGVIALFASIGCDRVFQIDTVGPSTDASGDTITVTFGETGTATYSGVTADTYLDSLSPTLNFGIRSKFSSDGGNTAELALIRFDISRLQGLVVSASLQLTTDTDMSVDPLAAVRVLETWEEGSFDGAAGAPNWTQASSSQAWSAPGAAPPSRDTMTLGSIVPSSADTTYELVLEPSVVAAWVADPVHNFGLALVTESSDGVSLRSSETSILSKRPLLTVKVIPPPL